MRLGADLGPFHLVLMGQSFHWMDRDEVLRRLFAMIEAGGGIALVNPGRRRPQEAWEDIVAPIVEAYLGPPVDHRQRNPEKSNDPALARSAFRVEADVEFAGEITRDVASILRCVYSMSFSRAALFGERRPAFEAEATAALLRAEPSGFFSSPIETCVTIARK